ncbi:TIGR03905 family TSCPD domain-containing protein [Geomonas oryzisoli]|uniref:ribonucleoside-diphosphate reductase n=1 Tax=Geomonas oryzisoli TaxID=2847992 RepID=A0ABX8JBT8_9BACT|nr:MULTISPECIES: TIGR03905 family TSCPD domain-containing protein [Geomonas]QWV94847.1 TIGR03905 family TSCPD domain-containing protein [Geomonas oryzisoli]
MKVSYNTSGSCASRIEIEIEDGVIVATKFVDGCAGNTQAVAALVRGMEVSEAIRRLKGIACQGDTSCPDQLARALEQSQCSTRPS